MKHIRHYLADARRHQGLALIIVLSMLALATIVILAFLSVADTEMKATNIYSASQTSRRFADTAVNMVISQIRSGSARETAGVPVIHATQPGAVRKYTQAGNFLAGYKLFSDKDMVFRALGGTVNQREQEFVSSSEPPAGWNEGANKARYVDLNEPVVKGVASATGNETTQVFFPIIDPRAGQDIDATTQEIPVEGFSYETKTAINKYNIGTAADGEDTQPILMPSDATRGAADQLRLAMPVQWLYLLKDGAVGYLNDGLEFLVLNNGQAGIGDGPSSTLTDQYGVPSESNPIVGRIAFWTDDETCKININTAAEPTFAGQPIYYHERDHRWADYPPTRSEYQRFPGHPATVALSTVFFPNPLQSANRSLDTYGPSGLVSGGDLSRALAVKAQIYDLMPRIHTGGSVAGTQTFDEDYFSKASGDIKATSVEMKDALEERLYASVDELLFSQKDDGSRRILNNATANAGGDNFVLFNKASLERSSAFLTASSRGSEINLFGLPRIAMWPINEDTTKRTEFDKLIEFCSRVGSTNNNYIFQRKYARWIPGVANGATYDIQIPRNNSLLKMLDKLMGTAFPTSNTQSTATSFVTKLGQDNTRQLLVSMFDYIRCINLHDSFLVKSRSEWPYTSWSNDTQAYTNTTKNLYDTRDGLEGDYDTYTPGVIKNSAAGMNAAGTMQKIDDPFEDRFLPGHGQVTPSESQIWQVGGKPVRGFGRFISISEIGLQFICTGDGQPDMYSWRIPVKDTRPEASANDYVIPDIPDNALEGSELVSGGRTALEVDEDSQQEFKIKHDYPRGFSGGDDEPRLKNVEDIHWQDKDEAQYSIKRRFYSNYPPLTEPNQPGRYNTTSVTGPINYGRNIARHPGYDPKNWNYTLPKNTALEPFEKRIQALLHLEFFCPSVAYTEITPDFTIILSGKNVNDIEMGPLGNGKSLFSTTGDVVLRSGLPLFNLDGSPEVGGFASFRHVTAGRKVKGVNLMPTDKDYEESVTGRVHSGLVNMDLVGNFMTVNRNDELLFRSSSEITIKVYDHHVSAGTRDEPVQILTFKLNEGRAPMPDLVTRGSYQVRYTHPNGSTYYHPALQAPRWWAFNADGALGRSLGVANPSLSGRFYSWPGVTPGINNGTSAVNNGAQRLPGARSLLYTKALGNFQSVQLLPHSTFSTNPLARIGYGPKPDGTDGSWNEPWHYGTDTLRTLQPETGDARLIAAKKVVPASEWVPHRLWNNPDEYVAHNFSSYNAGTEAGFDRGTSINSAVSDDTVRALPKSVYAGNSRSPDVPYTSAAAEAVQRYYDFDDSDPGGRIGPFINKVDEGNYSVGDLKLTDWTTARRWRSTYFRSDVIARYASGSGSFFTPNRMVPSPVVMGSLPSHVWGNNGESGAWTNLLFRPYLSYPVGETGSSFAAKGTHPGEQSPPDHYLLDLFWMPVVEPYAISEPLSTAGKINLNYQIMPFTHIRRATALHAAMKGELMAAMPNSDYEFSKVVKTSWKGTSGSIAPIFRSEASAGESKYWHHEIVVDRFKPESKLWWQQNINERVQGTLREFEERFNFGVGDSGGTLPAGFRGGLFRTTSQICEVHLIPSPVSGSSKDTNISASDISNYSSRLDNLAKFWGQHCSTGDNTRERPYANLYQKFTTRSNTFRVHVRAQSIRKALRSVAANTFDPNLDTVSAEFRGSFLLERYIDQADLAAAKDEVNYAEASDPLSKKPLENYYRFRVIESKRFAP